MIRTSETILSMVKNDPSASPADFERIRAAVENNNPPPRKLREADLLTTKQAAAMIGVHPVTLKNWGRKHILEPIRYTPRLYRWPRPTVEAFIALGANRD